MYISPQCVVRCGVKYFAKFANWHVLGHYEASATDLANKCAIKFRKSQQHAEFI